MKLERSFFARDCTQVAPDLVGKLIVRQLGGEKIILRISETEAYLGQQDSACHAYRGKTERNRLLWEKPGTIYIYLCYGIHWLLNAISGQEGQPQGVLIRACRGFDGPGKLTKKLRIDKSLNGGDFTCSDELWLEDDGFRPELERLPRVGINYANPEDVAALLRFREK